MRVLFENHLNISSPYNPPLLIRRHTSKCSKKEFQMLRFYHYDRVKYAMILFSICWRIKNFNLDSNPYYFL